MQITSQIMLIASKAIRQFKPKHLLCHNHVFINVIDEKVAPVLVKDPQYDSGYLYTTDVGVYVPINKINQRDKTLKFLIMANNGKYNAKECEFYGFTESDFIDMLNYMSGKPTHEEVLKKHPESKYLAQWPGNSDGSEVGRWISYESEPKISRNDRHGYIVDSDYNVVMHTIGEIVVPTKDTLEKVQPSKNVGNGKTILAGDICSVLSSPLSGTWEDAKFLGIRIDSKPKTPFVLYSAVVEQNGEIKHVYINHVRAKKSEEENQVETMAKHLDGVKDAKQIAEKLVALGYKLS